MDTPQTTAMLTLFAEHYQQELRVIHNWDLLHKHAHNLTCQIETTPVPATSDWLAPWFITTRPDGTIRPANILGGELDEQARHDQITATSHTPHWPEPIPFQHLPTGMRTEPIRQLQQHIQATQPDTITTLVYELAPTTTHDRRRIVLDGNHRLAATHQIHQTSPDFPLPTVLTYLIQEKHPVDEPTGLDRTDQFQGWRGFTPDVGLIRGTWKP